GCCGYEGADAFAARRLHRPRTAGDCSGEPPGWVDDWVADPADGTSVHARVRVNRVDVRWESSIAPAELFEKAEQLVGKPRGTSDRWIVLEPEHRFIYQVPIALMRDYPYTTGSIGTHREDLGLRVTTDHGRVSQVDFKLDAVDRDAFELMLKARWGAPKKLDAGLEFHANGHTITAFAEYENQVTIR
ncbi:MAG TPA: hypothetical protein VGC41_22665, partial [Kofleriaceae bacterium]